MPVCVAHGDAVKLPADIAAAMRAYDAACAAEGRLLDLDDPILDGTDAAQPAWWRGHDRATEAWRERVATAERERDTAIAEADRLRSVMRREIANTEHHENCPMRGTTDDADPRCNCVVGALHRALTGGAS